MDPVTVNALLSETSEDEDILPTEDEDTEDEPCDLEHELGSEVPVELVEEVKVKKEPEEKELEVKDKPEEKEGEEEGEEGQQSTSGDARTRDHYLGRDGSTKWHKTPPDRMPNNPLHITEVSGPKGPVKDTETLIQMWKCFITDEILDLLVNYTNQKIIQVSQMYRLDYITEITNKNEVVGVIGLLYLAGVFSSSRMKLEEFWADDGSGVEIFRAAMSLERFKFLLQNFRFEDSSVLEDKKKLDKLASVRRVIDIFASNCRNNFSIGESATVDEIRESFRGRCSFKRFMLDKPVRYGFKVYALCDSRTYYTHNLEVVADPGKNVGQIGSQIAPEEIVKRLVGPIKGTGRTVTVEGSFASVDLAMTLLEEYRLAMVGNLSIKHLEIPAEFLDASKRLPMSSIYGYSSRMTLCSHLPESEGIFIILSTRDQVVRVKDEVGAVSQEANDLVSFYNSTFGVVDDMDEVFGKYSTARNCRSTPLTIFFALLNVAGVNTQVIYHGVYRDKIARRRFLKALGIALVTEGAQDRCAVMGLNYLDNGSQSRRLLVSGSEPAFKRLKTSATRCSFCPRVKDRKTHTYCGKCNRAICKEHAESVCKECFVCKDN